MREYAWHAALILAIAVGADALVAYRPLGPAWMYGPLDTVLHAAIAFACVWPRWHQARMLCLVAVAAAFFIDVDHFVAAGGFDLAAATSLPCRPVTHSLTAAAGLAALAGGLRGRDAALLVFVGLATHVLRDAGGGTAGCTPVLAPLRWPTEVPRWLYLGATVLLGWAVRARAARRVIRGCPAALG